MQPFHLPLLALSPILLLVSLLISLPFLSLGFHLLLIGYFNKSTGSQEWHLRPYTGWLMIGTLLVWFWTWCVARDVLRVSVSGVIGSWYFTGVPTDGIEIARRAIYRALGPSLGTECLSALVLTAIDVATFLITAAMRVRGLYDLISSVINLPVLDNFTTCTCTIRGVLSKSNTLANEKHVHTQQLCSRLHRSHGDAFLRVRAACQSTHICPRYEDEDWLYVPLSFSPNLPLTAYHKLDRLLTILLILSAFSMGLIAAVGTYIFTAYTLGKPAHAPFASFLGGVVTFLVGWFCLSLVDDV